MKIKFQQEVNSVDVKEIYIKAMEIKPPRINEDKKHYVTRLNNYIRNRDIQVIYNPLERLYVSYDKKGKKNYRTQEVKVKRIPYMEFMSRSDKRLTWMRDIAESYHATFMAEVNRKFAVQLQEQIAEPNPFYFVLAVRDLFPNLDKDYLVSNLESIHTAVNNIKAKIGMKGYVDDKCIVQLFSDTLGGNGKTFFLNRLNKALSKMYISSSVTHINSRYQDTSTAENYVCVIPEFRYNSTDSSEDSFLNNVIDGVTTPYEQKYKMPLYLQPKCQLFIASTQRPPHINNRRFRIIKYGNYDLSNRDNYEKTKDYLSGDEDYIMCLFLKLFAYCPPRDYKFPKLNELADTTLYRGVHVNFLFEIQEYMKNEPMSQVFIDNPIIDLTNYIFENNNDINRYYTYKHFRNLMNQLIKDLNGKQLIKAKRSRGGGAEHCIYNLNDLMKISVASSINEENQNLYENVDCSNPIAENYGILTNYARLYMGANVSTPVKNIYDIFINFNTKDDTQDDTKESKDSDIVNIDDLMKDDALIEQLEKEDSSILSIDDLMDEEVELEETEVKLSEADIRKKLGMPECATLSSAPTLHHADNNQFWVSARYSNQYLIDYVKKIKAGKNPSLDRKSNNMVPTAFVYESDGLDLNAQKKIVKTLLESEYKDNVLSITYSGNKSIHILIKLRNDQGDALRDNFKDYWYLVGKKIFGKDIDNMDKACASVGRMTRLPHAINLSTGKKQVCYYLNADAKGFYIDLNKPIKPLREKIEPKKIEKKEKKEYNDNNIEGQFEAVCNKSKNSSAQIALEILNTGNAPQGNDLIFAVKYVANFIKYNPKFHSIGQKIVDICHSQHPSNIVYETIDEYIE